MKKTALNDNKYTWLIELLCVIAIATAFVLALTIGLGPMNSGWHLVDDHQFLQYYSRFKYNNESLMSVILSELKRDAFQQHRARFLYYPTRVIQTYIFGLNLVPYYIVKSVEGIIAFCYLYYAGRELKLARFRAALFAIIVLAGHQGAVLWKLGPQHLQSTMFMAIGLYYMIVYLRLRKRAPLIGSLVSFLLMACFHESFVVEIPFLVLFVLYHELHSESEDNNAKLSVNRILNIVRKDSQLLIPLAGIFIVIMLYIAAFLGIFSYGVVKEDVPVRNILSNLKAGFIDGHFTYYFWFGVALLIILISYYENVKPIWQQVLLAAAFALPQIMLYTSEPFYERYLLPLTFGWSLLFVAGYGTSILSGARRVMSDVLLVLMALLLIRTTVIDADYYRFRGDSVTAALNEALKISEQGYNVTSILGISNPEADMVIGKYLVAYGQDDCWYWHEGTKIISNTPPYSGIEDGEKYDISDVGLFVEYNRDDGHFRVDPTLDLTSFHLVKCGSLNLYFSDEVYKTLTAEDLEKFKVKPTIYGIGAQN